MQHKIIILLISVFPFFAFSQSYISADSANSLIMNGGDCSDRTFTKIETLPSLKIPREAFADSISKCLKSGWTSFEDGTIKLRFIVDCHSNIKEIESITGYDAQFDALKAAILKLSHLWLPGRQNNYIESAYILLTFEFKNNVIDNFTITQ
jgi:hypothetical protein